MKVIVITGSTRGIGFGLAREFLKRGSRVVVSSRTQGAVDKAVAALSSEFDAANILGVPCDVTQYAQLDALWNAAKQKFGRVDVWINNAGISIPRVAVWEQTPEKMRAVVDSNLLAVMYASQIVLREMLQQGGGQLYNMEGFGSGGQKAEGLAFYGATKRAVTYFTESLIADVKDKPVQVGILSPGIVVTDLLTDDYAGMPEKFERAKKFFNILGDRVETVTPYLAERVLANTKNGARIEWLNTPKVALRFLTAGFSKRDLFQADKN